MNRTFSAVGAALALAATACGNKGATVSTGSGDTRRPAGSEMVVQVLVDGGFVPVEMAVASVPTVTVLGDGTVITAAPMLAIYPGAAIAPLQQSKLDAAGVDRLIAKADALGLLEGPLDFGQPPVADAPNTTVTVVAGGRTHRHVANALGIFDREPARGGVPGLSAEAVANRKALSEFVDATNALPPGSRAWVPTAVAVYDLGPYQADPQLPQREAPWPLTRPPATPATTSGLGWACTLVEGTETATLLDALARANSRTPWIVDGVLRSLAFRPVVPGQPGCPG